MNLRRILAVDLGAKRVGLAISDPMGLIAQPAGYIPYRNRVKLADEIKKIVDDKSVGLILVGVPKMADGSIGENARHYIETAEMIRQRCGVGLKLWDEQYTTREAEEILVREMDLSRTKRRKTIDSVAACLILRSYMDSPQFKKND